MPRTVTQRDVAQFTHFTGAPKDVATTYLKKYRLENAVEQYFKDSEGGAGAGAGRETKLNTMFDQLQDTQKPQDSVGVEEAFPYFEKMGVNPEDASLWVLLEIVQSPSFGQITREGFVKGWSATQTKPDEKEQQDYVTQQVAYLAADPALFKKVYRHAFIAGKEPEQKALSLDNAITFWSTLFSSPGTPWVGKATGQDWLGHWTKFLQEKWTRSVNKDMWNQTLEFAFKSMEDESLGFWSEDGAWPGVIDDFVAWYKANFDANGAAKMDVDA